MRDPPFKPEGGDITALKNKAESMPPSRSIAAPSPLQSTPTPWVARAIDAAGRNRALIALAVIVVLFQGYVWSGSAPNVFPDTWTYAGLAENILKGKWEGYGSTSLTPGYPFFLAVAFGIFGVKNYAGVMALQFMLSVAMPLSFYFIFLPVLRNQWLAAAAACGFLLDRHSVGLMTVPLTEPMSAITLAVALAAFVIAIRDMRVWTAPVVGALFWVNLIVRPSFQMLFICMTLGGVLVELFYKDSRSNWKKWASWYAAFFFTVQLGIWGWSAVTYARSGSFGLTATVYGYLTNQTGYFLHLAPDEYAPVRDYYVRELQKNNGDNTNLLIKIIGQMEQDLGIPRKEIERQFESMNSYLIRAHPGEYARQIQRTWRRMWLDDSRYITDITDPDGSGTGRIVPTAFFRHVASSGLLRALYMPIENLYWANSRQSLRVATPYALLILAATGIFLRRRDRIAVIAICAALGAVMYHMLLHAMVQATEFGRYRLPPQALWVSLLLAMLLLIGVESYRILRPDSTTGGKDLSAGRRSGHQRRRRGKGEAK